MKTQQELMQAYWGPGGIVDMVKEYNEKHGCDVKPWECVKQDLVTWSFDDYTEFSGGSYTFALTILYDDKRKEHRPVFVGDKIYCVTGNGQPWTVSSIAAIAKPGAWDKWSWNPPTPKRTFKLGDKEFLCPVKERTNTLIRMSGENIYFQENSSDYKSLCKHIRDILTAARDKE